MNSAEGASSTSSGDGTNEEQGMWHMVGDHVDLRGSGDMSVTARLTSLGPAGWSDREFSSEYEDESVVRHSDPVAQVVEICQLSGTRGSGSDGEAELLQAAPPRYGVSIEDELDLFLDGIIMEGGSSEEASESESEPMDPLFGIKETEPVDVTADAVMSITKEEFRRLCALTTELTSENARLKERVASMEENGVRDFAPVERMECDISSEFFKQENETLRILVGAFDGDTSSQTLVRRVNELQQARADAEERVRQLVLSNTKMASWLRENAERQDDLIRSYKDENESMKVELDTLRLRVEALYHTDAYTEIAIAADNAKEVEEQRVRAKAFDEDIIENLQEQVEYLHDTVEAITDDKDELEERLAEREALMAEHDVLSAQKDLVVCELEERVRTARGWVVETQRQMITVRDQMLRMVRAFEAGDDVQIQREVAAAKSRLMASNADDV